MGETGSHSSGLERLLRQLDNAAAQEDIPARTQEIKRTLQDCCRRTLDLPRGMTEPSGNCYARRLLHRSPELGYTVVVMTWGPAQSTPLHDHAGIWCVECVVQGELDVTQYELIRSEGSRFQFRRQNRVRAGVGDAGCLIPPFEYHVLSNPRDDRSAVTLHVYGGEMDHCNAYEPEDDGWWSRRPRALTYDA